MGESWLKRVADANNFTCKHALFMSSPQSIFRTPDKTQISLIDEGTLHKIKSVCSLHSFYFVCSLTK